MQISREEIRAAQRRPSVFLIASSIDDQLRRGVCAASWAVPGDMALLVAIITRLRPTSGNECWSSTTHRSAAVLRNVIGALAPITRKCRGYWSNTATEGARAIARYVTNRSARVASRVREAALQPVVWAISANVTLASAGEARLPHNGARLLALVRFMAGQVAVVAQSLLRRALPGEVLDASALVAASRSIHFFPFQQYQPKSSFKI